MPTSPQEELPQMPEMPPMPPPQGKQGKLAKTAHLAKEALLFPVKAPVKAVKAVRGIPDALSSVEAHVPESISHPKETLMGAIHGTREYLHESFVGSKSIPTEFTKLKDSYVDFFKKSITSNLKAAGQLVTLHPVKAVKEFIYGTTGNLKNMTDIITSPSRFAVAGGAKAVNVAKGAAKLPFKAVKGIANSPFKAWGLLDKGTDKLFGIGERLKAWNRQG